MPVLYIANSTKQNYEFQYRLPENTKIFNVKIPYGGQEKLLQTDLSVDVIDHILKQHKGDTHEYMVEASSIDRTDGFVGLIYSFDKPVPAELIGNTIAENDFELDQSAKRFREETALAIDKKLEEDGVPASQVSTEVVQDVKNGVSEADAIAQGTEVKRGRPGRK